MGPTMQMPESGGGAGGQSPFCCHHAVGPAAACLLFLSADFLLSKMRRLGEIIPKVLL